MQSPIAQGNAQAFPLNSRVYLKTPNAPGQRTFSRCAAPFSLKYVSIPAKKCLAQRKNFSLPVTLGVFRYTLTGGIQREEKSRILALFFAAVSASAANTTTRKAADFRDYDDAARVVQIGTYNGRCSMFRPWPAQTTCTAAAKSSLRRRNIKGSVLIRTDSGFLYTKRKNPRNHCDFKDFSGAAGQIRTADLVITNDALYRLSYSSKSLSQERSVIIA